MHNIMFKIKGLIPKDTLIFVDDVPTKFKKDKHHNLSCNYQTEKSKVSLKIVRYFDANSKHWFFWQIFMFLITIFGIFSPRVEKKPLELNSEFEFEVSENTEIVLTANAFKDCGKAYEVTSSLPYVELKNKFRVSKEVKKKYKKLKTAKIVTFLGVLVLAIILLIVLLKK